jgi:hypothetical protein
VSDISYIMPKTLFNVFSQIFRKFPRKKSHGIVSFLTWSTVDQYPPMQKQAFCWKGSNCSFPLKWNLGEQLIAHLKPEVLNFFTINLKDFHRTAHPGWQRGANNCLPTIFLKKRLAKGCSMSLDSVHNLSIFAPWSEATDDRSLWMDYCRNYM